MGTRIFVDGKYSGENIHLAKYVPPISLGAAYIGILNETIEKVSRDYASIGTLNNVVGEPVVTKTSTTFIDNQAYVDTQIPDDSVEITLFFVAKFGNRNGTLIGSHSGAGTPSLSIIEYENNWRLNVFFQNVSLTGGVVVPARGVGLFDLCSLRVLKVGQIVLTNHTTGVIKVHTPPAGQVRSLSHNKIRVGSTISTATGSCEVSRIALYKREFSDAEIAHFVAQWRKEMALDGVTV